MTQLSPKLTPPIFKQIQPPLDAWKFINTNPSLWTQPKDDIPYNFALDFNTYPMMVTKLEFRVSLAILFLSILGILDFFSLSFYKWSTTNYVCILEHSKEDSMFSFWKIHIWVLFLVASNKFPVDLPPPI